MFYNSRCLSKWVCFQKHIGVNPPPPPASGLWLVWGPVFTSEYPFSIKWVCFTTQNVIPNGSVFRYQTHTFGHNSKSMAAEYEGCSHYLLTFLLIWVCFTTQDVIQNGSVFRYQTHSFGHFYIGVAPPPPTPRPGCGSPGAPFSYGHLTLEDCPSKMGLFSDTEHTHPGILSLGETS